MPSRKRVGLEDFFELFGDIAGPAVLDLERTHTLPGELIAVEHGNQFQRAAHVAAVIQNDQQVGRIVALIWPPSPTKGARTFRISEEVA